MSARSIRRLQPFAGVLHVLDLDLGRAVTQDGDVWQVQVAQDVFASSWSSFGPDSFQPSYVPFCYWSQGRILRRLPVSPMIDREAADHQAAELVAELERAQEGLPFPSGDRYELWLLDPRDWSPLALMASACEPSAMHDRNPGRWKAFPLHRDADLNGAMPDSTEDLAALVRQVESLVNRRGGSTHVLQWFLREPDGSAQGLTGRHLKASLEHRRLEAEAFPRSPLTDHWPDARERELLDAYRRRMAPLLLTLSGLPRDLRLEIERLAWRQPLATLRLHRLYPEVIDRDGLKVALVTGRIRLGAESSART